MALKIDPEVVSTVVKAVSQHPKGASLNDIIAAFPNPPARRTAHFWATSLVDAGTLKANTRSKVHLYFLADDANGANLEPKSGGSLTVGQPAGVPAAPVAPAPAAGEAPTAEPKPAPSPKPAAKPHKKPTEQLAAPPSPTAKLLTPIIQEVFNPIADALPAHPTAGEGISNEMRVKRSIGKILADAVRKFDPSNPWPAIRYIIYAIVAVVAVVFVRKLLAWVSQHPWITVLVSVGVIAVLLGYAAWRKRSAAGKPVPASTAGNPPAAADPPASHRKLYFGLAGIAVAVAAVAWGIWSMFTPAKPPTATISKYVVETLAPLPVKVAAIDLTYLSVGSAGCRLTYTARVETTDALFKRANAADYLRAHFPNELAAINAATALLAGPDGPRLRAAVAAASVDQSTANSVNGSADKPLSPASRLLSPTDEIVLLSVQTKTGTTVKLTRTVDAWQHNGDWVFQDIVAEFDHKIVAGEPRPAGATVFVMEYPDETAKLKSLIADQAAYAGKVQAAAAEFSKTQSTGALQLREAVGQLLQRGTFLSGVVVDAARQASHRVLIEVTECSTATHRVTLVLRNTSGWYNTRSGEGEWSVDAETCTANVWFSSGGRIAGAGIPLDYADAWYLTLRVQLDGTLTANPTNWQLHRVAAADLATIKAEFGETAAGGVQKTDGVGSTTVDEGPKAAVRNPTSVGEPSSALSPSHSDAATPAAVPAHQLPIAENRAAPAALPASRQVGVSASPAAIAAPKNQQPVTIDSPAAPVVAAFPPVATSQPQAYVLDHNWLPLPASKSQMVQSTPQKLSGALTKLSQWEDSLAGKTSPTAPAPVGELILDSRAYVPVVSGKGVVIAYVGPVTPITSELQQRYPVLKDYPLIELAAERTSADGRRHASLYPIAPGFIGFGPKRIAATLEWVDLRVIQGTHTPALLLRCTADLPPGQYALMCGALSYEVAVQ